MRWLGRAAALVAAVPLLAGCASFPPGSEPDSGRRPAAAGALPGPVPDDCDTGTSKRQLRGTWITTVRNIDWPSKPGLSKRRQQKELRAQLDRAKELGLNAVFFHARPTADAVYASDKEPWARYLTGEQGGDPGYDPLKFAVAEAHERGLELHAWFNPYRVGWKDPDLENLTDDHPAKRHPEWLVRYDDQGWLDPGNPEVRAWVTGVVLDVVERYAIDGVHFDDYFYPYPAEGETFDDDATWKRHGDDFDSRADWRRHNVNALIADVHRGIERTKPWVRFGVSPFGIYRNDSTDPTGSATKGLESYDAQYADTRAWIRAGTVDYVVPQLYWPPGYDTADYAGLVPWWANEVAGSGVDLYIGQAAFRVGEDGWKGDDALTRQLDVNAKHPEVGGDVYFSVSDLSGRARTAIERVAEERYQRPALPPRAEGGGDAPDPVTGLRAQRSGGKVRLEWDAVKGARSYAVYRVPGTGDDLCALADASHLVTVTGPQGSGRQGFTDSGAPDDEPVRYHVTALDAYRAESDPSAAARVRAR